MMWNNSLYGNFRTRKFTDIYPSASDFLNDYKKTLEPVYGDAVNPEDIVVEGGEVN